MHKIIKKLIFYIILIVSLLNCSKESENSLNTRTYLMGFQNSAPRADFDLVIQSLHIWEQRADAAIITTEVPWDSLFNGVTPEKYVLHNYYGLADYYRLKNFKLWVYIDPENGLNRASDATALVNKGKSISQPEIQLLYKRFTFVMDSILKPEHLGLALETNLIRGIASESIYQGVKKAANEASQEIREYDKTVKLSISVQVDYAWGKLGNSSTSTIDQDFIDFPFIQELGLSSYPYFGFENPKDIPADYYSKLIDDRNIPVFISEGGWSSEKVTNYTSSQEKQREYIIRQSQLLDQVGAIALFQLTFTDIDVESLSLDTPQNIAFFSYLGLVDKDLMPKLALNAWDNIYNREYLGN